MDTEPEMAKNKPRAHVVRHVRLAANERGGCDMLRKKKGSEH